MHGPVCGLNYLSTYMKRGPYSHVNSNSILPTYIDITDIAHSLKCCLPVDKRPTCTERVELSFTCRQGLSEILFLGSVLKDTSKALQFIVQFDYISFDLLAMKLNWKAEIASFAYLHHANQPLVVHPPQRYKRLRHHSQSAYWFVSSTRNCQEHAYLLFCQQLDENLNTTLVFAY